jgi:hypothetical protein
LALYKTDVVIDDVVTMLSIKAGFVGLAIAEVVWIKYFGICIFLIINK